MLPIVFFHRLSLMYSSRGVYAKLYRESAIFRTCMILSLIFWNVCYPMITHGLALSVAYLTTLGGLFIKWFGGSRTELFVKCVVGISAVVYTCLRIPMNYRTLLYFTILSTSAFHIGFEYWVYKYGAQVEDMYHVFIFNDDNVEHVAGGNPGVFAEFGVMEPREEGDVEHIRNDRQNVHDSTVNKTLKRTVDELKEVTAMRYSKEETLREVRDLVEAERDTVRKQRMKVTLDKIIRDGTRISNIDMTLVELLQLIWNRYHDPSLEEKRDTLISNLLDQMVDSTEVTVKPLCTTGIYARLVDSANCVDPLVTIKPKWALRRELLDYAGSLYKDMVAELGEVDRERLNTFEPDQTDTAWLTDFRNKYQLRLLNYCKRTYIDTKLLTKKELHKEIDTWIDSIV